MPLEVSEIEPVRRPPLDDLGRFQLQLALPFDDVERCEAPSALPFSFAPHDSDPATPLPARLTVNATVNGFPACALPTANPLAASVGAFTVRVRVMPAIAPPSSVTVSLTLYDPGLVYVWLVFGAPAVAPSPKSQTTFATWPSGSDEAEASKATVSAAPPAGEAVNDAVGGLLTISRIRWLWLSATKTSPRRSTATSDGPPSWADVA